MRSTDSKASFQNIMYPIKMKNLKKFILIGYYIYNECGTTFELRRQCIRLGTGIQNFKYIMGLKRANFDLYADELLMDPSTDWRTLTTRRKIGCVQYRNFKLSLEDDQKHNYELLLAYCIEPFVKRLDELKQLDTIPSKGTRSIYHIVLILKYLCHLA